MLKVTSYFFLLTSYFLHLTGDNPIGVEGFLDVFLFKARLGHVGEAEVYTFAFSHISQGYMLVCFLFASLIFVLLLELVDVLLRLYLAQEFFLGGQVGEVFGLEQLVAAVEHAVEGHVFAAEAQELDHHGVFDVLQIVLQRCGEGVHLVDDGLLDLRLQQAEVVLGADVAVKLFNFGLTASKMFGKRR